MSELDLKIVAVEFSLRSFARADNEDTRKSTLRENFETIRYLDTYFEFTITELKVDLQQLQQLKIDENASQRLLSTPKGKFNSFSYVLSLLNHIFKLMIEHV